MIGGVERILTLEIKKSNLTKVNDSALYPYVKLGKLEISGHNNLHIGQNAFSNLKLLDQLTIIENHLSSLPNEIPTSLTWLDISDNILSAEESLATILERYTLPDLEEFYLTNMSIAILPMVTKMGAINIHIFWAYHNQITSVNAAIFHGCRSLEELDLSNNPLTRFPTPQELPNVLNTLLWLGLENAMLSCSAEDAWKNTQIEVGITGGKGSTGWSRTP